MQLDFDLGNSVACLGVWQEHYHLSGERNPLLKASRRPQPPARESCAGDGTLSVQANVSFLGCFPVRCLGICSGQKTFMEILVFCVLSTCYVPLFWEFLPS